MRPRLGLRKRRLAGEAAEGLAEKRLAAIAEIGRFLADPCAFRSTETAPPDRSYGWLAQAHVPWALFAQENALKGDFLEAERAIRQALAVIEPSDNSGERWMDAALRPATPPRELQARRELAAVARAFLAMALLAQGDKDGAKKQIECACRAQPSMDYLHEVRADVLMADDDYAEAFVATDRAALLRGAAHAGSRLGGIVALAIPAIRAKRAAGGEDERRVLAQLLDRAAARLGAALNEKLDADANQIAAAQFWRGRLALEQAALREASDKAPSADREHAKGSFDRVARMNGASQEWREAAEGWLAVAKKHPWQALHELLARSREGSDPFKDELAAALIDSASLPAAPHRLVLRLPAEMLPDNEVERLIFRQPGANPATIDLVAFHDAVRETIGIEPPSVLISRMIGSEQGRVDVLLDGVPIGTQSFQTLGKLSEVDRVRLVRSDTYLAASTGSRCSVGGERNAPS